MQSAPFFQFINAIRDDGIKQVGQRCCMRTVNYKGHVSPSLVPQVAGTFVIKPRVRFAAIWNRVVAQNDMPIE